MTIFGMMMFILMIAIGGIAIDIMRYETQRAQLQYTLDRAVLAGAALNQTLDPEAVVLDYFARSGLTRYRIDVDVDESMTHRTVSAQAEMDINTIFMDMFGIRALTSPAYGQAEERVQNIEISMVLDVSGSMGWSSANGQTKLYNLQQAANDFVAQVMTSNDYATDDMLVSISIVPYNGFVNAGTMIDDIYPISNIHNASNCTRFRGTQFDRTDLGTSETIQRLSHFDYSRRGSYSYFGSPYCPTSNLNSILPWSSSVTDLQAMISGFQATGWTAIDQGMRWGVTLLDPTSQDELTSLYAAGLGPVHEDFVGRPGPYDDADTLKIIVLMTDGENTEQWDVADAYRSGGSGIYYHEEDDRWSIWYPMDDHVNGGEYWIPDPRPDDSTTFNNPYGYWSANPYDDGNSADGHDSEEYSWQWMWANFTERSIGQAFYYYPAYWTGDWDFHDAVRYDGLELFSGLEVSGQAHIDADANLRSICNAANGAGIVVYTIAFEAPDRGQQVMQDCATTDGNYYEVEGLEIAEAFESIASTINRLRLTQ
ncbi:MAG: pilus assembly protein TadG-related protein [Pseudomonadota bacterium]